MKLSELKPTESGIVVKIGCETAFKTRLSHLGLTEGVKVTFIRVAPLADPIEISIRGFYLALRKQTADLIEVKKI